LRVAAPALPTRALPASTGRRVAALAFSRKAPAAPAGTFRLVVFLVTVRFAVVVLAADVFAGVFRAVDFFAVVFFAGVFFAGLFAAVFFPVDFLAAVFFAVAFLALVFFAAVVAVSADSSAISRLPWLNPLPFMVVGGSSAVLHPQG
jgi:hypothetical protein